MFELVYIIRFLSILLYIGFIISSITGFLMIHEDPLNISSLIASIMILITNVVYIWVDMFKIMTQYMDSEKYIYYLRGGVILHSSLLAIGISSVGLGFGIFGVLIILANVFAGLFYTEESSKYSLGNNYVIPDSLNSV